MFFSTCSLLTGTPYSSAVCLRKGAHEITNIPKVLKICLETEIVLLSSSVHHCKTGRSQSFCRSFCEYQQTCLPDRQLLL